MIRQRAAEKERNREASQNAQPGTIKRMQFTFAVDQPHQPPSAQHVEKPDFKPSSEFRETRRRTATRTAARDATSAAATTKQEPTTAIATTTDIDAKDPPPLTQRGRKPLPTTTSTTPSTSAAVVAFPSPSSPASKRPRMRERLSISKIYRRLSRALAPSSRGSPPSSVRSPEPEPASSALQVPPSSSSTDGMNLDPPTGSLPPPRGVEACEITAPSADVSDALMSTSSAVVDVAGAPANPMTTMWTEAVAEWQRKAGVDLNAPEATLFSSKEALASYVAKMEVESQGGTAMDRWGRLRNTLFRLARIVAKLCGPIGDTLSSTVSDSPSRNSHRVDVSDGRFSLPAK